jgi:hypothetical protein
MVELILKTSSDRPQVKEAVPGPMVMPEPSCFFKVLAYSYF